MIFFCLPGPGFLTQGQLIPGPFSYIKFKFFYFFPDEQKSTVYLHRIFITCSPSVDIGAVFVLLAARKRAAMSTDEKVFLW